MPDGARVIRKTSGLYVTANDATSAAARKQAELEHRMQRLAAALSAADDGSSTDEGGADR